MNARTQLSWKRGLSRFRRQAAVVLVASLAAAVSVIGAPAASAAALTTVNWSVSNNQAGATGVVYSYSFKTATAGTIGKIVLTVSGSGLAGTPTIVKNYGVPAGTVARAGQVIIGATKTLF